MISAFNAGAVVIDDDTLEEVSSTIAGSDRRWTTPRRRASTRPSSGSSYPVGRFATKDQARWEVAGFIDTYNHRRRHSSCEMLPPAAYEQVLAQRAAKKYLHGEAA